MDLSDIRDYMNRDWDAAERVRPSGTERDDAAARLARIDAARNLLRALRPGWPGERARAEDLEHHIRLSALLRRVER